MQDRGNACIAVDAMGADKGPAEVVSGVAMALKDYPDIAPIVKEGEEMQQEAEEQSWYRDQEGRLVPAFEEDH